LLPKNGLRHDILHDTWVIIAPQRGQRPIDQRLHTVAEIDQPCPFCPGSEHETPPAILTVADDRPHLPEGSRPGERTRPVLHHSDWRIRVFPNRYPAVTGSDGRHEVVVVTAHHEHELADLGVEALAEVLESVQARVLALQADPQIAAVLFFLNAGAGAGASLAHTHGQILATSVVPAILRTECMVSEAWRKEHQTCLICDLADRARQDERMIAEDDDALLFAPHASRFAWEMMILPRQHQARYSAAGRRELAAAARMLDAACRALRAMPGRPAYNLVLHTAPAGVQDFHWHLELLPRLSPLAGFETGAGFFINPVRPHDAAAMLRPFALGRDSTGQ
jgi:UDPglucose--hexose-1-phosphate uridylyltransferase